MIIVKKSKKDHTCSKCKNKILEGSTYYNQDEKRYTNGQKLHIACVLNSDIILERNQSIKIENILIKINPHIFTQ